MDKKYDVITIGGATADIFVKTPDAGLITVEDKTGTAPYMVYPYGTKMDVNELAFEVGGGGLNTALNFKNLGLNTTTIIKIGEDHMANAIMEVIKENNVDSKYIVVAPDEMTGISVILVSFQGDRTVLAHRGTNATLKSDEIDYEAIKESKWVYLAPLNGESTKCLNDIAKYAVEYDTNLAINLGTSTIKNKKNKSDMVVKAAKIVILNLEEAQMLTEMSVRPNSSEENFDSYFIHPDTMKIMQTIREHAGKVIVVTDGKNGSYAYDGDKFYRCGEFPAKVVSTLGAGDAFASTFTAVYGKTGDVKKALEYASINASSVVSVFSAQKGFLTFDEIKTKLESNPDYHAEEIDACK